MSSSQHPSFLPDTTQYIFERLSLVDVKAARLVCRDWRNQVDALKLLEKRRLEAEFKIPFEVASTLESPGLVCRRLARVYERRKNKDFLDSRLYRIYCAGGNINLDFLHLLDTHEKWFRIYFSDRDSFFLSYHLTHACLIGNLSLIRFLVESKNCTPIYFHFRFAVASGDLPSVTYLFDKISAFPQVAYQEKLYKHAFYSGNVEVLKFVMHHFSRSNQEMTYKDFSNAVLSGSVDMVKFTQQTGPFSVHDIPRSATNHLNVLRYFTESCGWIPKDVCLSHGLVETVISGHEELYKAGCRTGQVEMLEYLESQFPLPRSSNEFIKESFQAAAESGDLACLRRVRELNPIGLLTSQSFPDFEQLLILASVCSAGNLESLKFLISECGFPLIDGLMVYAAESGNIQMVTFLMESQEAFTAGALLKAFECKNIELISMLSPVINLLTPQQVEEVAQNNPFIMYYFISKKNYPITQKMFDCVFNRYLFLCAHSSERCIVDEKISDLFQFIRYLVEAHHFAPSQALRDRAEEASLYDIESTSEILALLPPKKDDTHVFTNRISSA